MKFVTNSLIYDCVKFLSRDLSTDQYYTLRQILRQYYLSSMEISSCSRQSSGWYSRSIIFSWRILHPDLKLQLELVSIVPSHSDLVVWFFDGWGKCCTWNDCTSSDGVNLTSHVMYNTYSIPTAASRTAPWLRVTVPHRVELIWPRSQAPWPFTRSSTVKFISYRGIGSRKCSFPAKCVGIFDDETFTEVRGWDGFSWRKPPLSWLRSKS